MFLENNIISKNQYGLQKNLSTEDPLQLLTNAVLKGVKKLAIFLDLQKAFQRVSHSQRLNKLNKVGISGNVYDLLK